MNQISLSYLFANSIHPSILPEELDMAAQDGYAFRPYVDATPAGYHWLKQFIGSVLVVEGHIASGKTTFGTMLAEFATAHGRRAVFLPERFPEAQLNLFIEWNDAHKEAAQDESGLRERNPHAFAFQMAMLDERQRTYREALALSELGYIVIIDRSLPGDYVFAAVNHDLGDLSPEEWTAYEAKTQATDLLAPTVIIKLDTTVEDDMRRIGIRARGSEAKYKRSYMDAIDAKYRRVLSALPYPMLTLPWGRDRHMDDRDERAAISKAVFQALEQFLHADRDGARTNRMRMQVVV